jgi:bifunctional non-homologous end joining protein LigD
VRGGRRRARNSPYAIADGAPISESIISFNEAALSSLAAGDPTGQVLVASRIPAPGAAIFRQACAVGLEGIVSKWLSAPYRPGPSPGWLKIKNPVSPAMVRAREGEW